MHVFMEIYYKIFLFIRNYFDKLKNNVTDIIVITRRLGFYKIFVYCGTYKIVILRVLCI